MQRALGAAALISVAIAALAPSAAPAADNAKTARAAGATQLERGRYLVRIGGCNDCHTPGYAESGGKTPEAQWLTGSPLGWRGPWGTTYPVNLRTYMQSLTEAQWLKAAKTMETRPPMPWFNVQQLSTADLRALYAFVRGLGPAGEAAPSYLPPDKEPSPPFVQFPGPPTK